MEAHSSLRPPPRHRLQLAESAHAWQKQRLADNLRLSGIDGDDMLDELEQFDAENDPTENDIIAYCNGGAGTVEALELAPENNDD